MGRIRSIKPEFFTSEDVSALPLRARLTWIGLWTQCDDHGRSRDNVKLIKAAVWPLDDVSLRDVEDDLTTLSDQGLIVRYTVDGRDYLAVTGWDKHQSASFRRGDPKHPPPPGVQESADSTQPRASGTSMRAGAGSREQGAGGRTHTRADPRRCTNHQHHPNPPPCGQCAEARRTADSAPTPSPPQWTNRLPERDPTVAAAGSAAVRSVLESRKDVS